MKQSAYFSGIDFTALIHTMQGVSDNALLPEDEINAKPYIKNFHLVKQKAVYRINPNKYGVEITSLAELKNTLSLILDELYVTDYEIKRLDVSINTIVPFDEIYKINNYLKELYAVHIREDNSYHTNGDDLKKRSLKVTGTKYELEIYDKELESKGLDPFKTRIEFRFKRLRKNQSIDNIVKSIFTTLDLLPAHIQELNEKKVSQLYNEYLVEQSPDYEGRMINLPTFVSKYADFIYNMEMLKGLHGKVCSGKCKNWLYRYRTSGKTLTLYTKGDLLAYIKQLKTGLKKYVKGNAEQSPLNIKTTNDKVA